MPDYSWRPTLVQVLLLIGPVAAAATWRHNPSFLFIGSVLTSDETALGRNPNWLTVDLLNPFLVS